MSKKLLKNSQRLTFDTGDVEIYVIGGRVSPNDERIIQET